MKPCLIPVLIVCCTLGVRAAGPMNVLFIALDDLNNYPAMMGNYPGVKTPHMDAFAKSALRFDRAYSPGTMCNPSRLAILSGIAPYRSGVYENGHPWERNPLFDSVRTIPQLFRESGFHTMTSGKIFHGHPSKPRLKLMWDDADGGAGRFAPAAKPNPIPDSVKKPGLFSYGSVEEERVSDFRLLDFARKRMAAKYDKPFFYAHGIRYPHNPWTVPQRFLDLYPEDSLRFPPPGYREGDLDDMPAVAKDYAAYPVNRAALEKAGHWKPVVRHYLASVSAADECFGEVIKALDRSEHGDNTIVVVWADHGFHMGEKDHFAKYGLWEQTTNVLFMIRVPGLTQAGGVSKRTVSLQDIYPTLIELAGLEAPGHPIDGRSLVPLLKNPQADWPYPALTTHHHNDYAVRSEDWRYIRYHDGSEELYDHRKDPGEFTNLAGDPRFADVKRDLAKRFPDKSVEPMKGKKARD
ncbi:iduronate-2-sulfatase [Haloferula helveola]|uniref:Iduronate-2-sulfatase n=1 Tax=Haloferula helveola TaxID=490095 RepID=A0ABN6H029_9BACT|nr:iduronate-2-sulfatase [Haloferula helveola]